MKLLQQMTVMGHERVVFHQDPESGLRAVIAVHDVLRAEGRPLDPAVASSREVGATLLRAIEVRDLIRAGLWPE